MNEDDIDLFERYLTNNLSALEKAAMAQRLDGDPEFQEAFVRYVEESQDLRVALTQSVSGEQSGMQSFATTPTRRPRNRRLGIGMAAAIAASAFIALGLGIGRWTQATSVDTDFTQTEVADDGVAVLTGAVDAKWPDIEPLQTGSILSPGELKLAGGMIQIEFYNGVQMLVEGPADLEIQSVARVVCSEGKLRSHVPPHASGFSVLTPKFDLVDLGTEFAVDVASDGQSDVHVFDGEVELYHPDGQRRPDGKQVLLGGDAMKWPAEGLAMSRAAVPEAFASFDTIRMRGQSASHQRFGNWRRWNETLRDDPRVVTRYDFQEEGSTLIDSGAAQAHGTIVGCEWVSGRWPEKRALEFRRPGDRVRINVPGQYDQLTLSMWMRMDALPNRTQALVLTDGYEVGRVHWQVNPEGQLRLGFRLPLGTRKNPGVGYGSPTLITPRSLGAWNFLCSVYDRKTQVVRHFFNGRQVSSETMIFDHAVQFGIAEIGNWGVPIKPIGPHAIRNFIGRIDELTIWNTALEEQEIAKIHSTSHP